MTEKSERVGSYLTKYAEEFVFDQFQESYLKRERIGEFMGGVPIPLKAQDVVDFHSQKGLQVLNVAQNMIRVIGINPKFQYADSYLRYIRKYFDANIVEAVIRDGEQRADKGKVEEALIYFRAALVMDPRQRFALYDYGVACRRLYEGGAAEIGPGETEGELPEAYRGALKADSIETFEELASLYPAFYPAYYYLGYIYLNMGLYTKAQLSFQQYLQLSQPETVSEDCRNLMSEEVLAEQQKEVRERVKQLEEPVRIEGGINHILAGRMEPGILILEPYVGSTFDAWWPLHYYLGVAYVGAGQIDEAIARFRQVLQLCPSHTETMEELAAIYEARGDNVMCEKYRNKIALIKNNAAETGAVVH